MRAVLLCSVNWFPEHGLLISLRRTFEEECNKTFLSEPCSSQCVDPQAFQFEGFVSNAMKKFMVAEPVGSTDGT